MTKDIINERIGSRIKALRKEQGLTLLELANKVDLSEGNVQRYESGNISNVSVVVLEKFAKALCTTTSYLMGWEEEEPQGYYTDPEAAEYAEYARTNPNIRVLFSAAKNISKKDMEKAVEYIQFLKSKEHNDYTFSDDISDGDFIDDVADDNFSE